MPKSKARISAYEKLLGKNPEKMARELEIYIPPGPRLGDVVIEADSVSKAYGDTTSDRGDVFHAAARRDHRGYRP